MVAHYKQKQQDLNLQLEDHTNADESFLINASYLLELSNRAAELFESSKEQEKRQLLNFLLSNCTLKGDILLFNLKPPFDAIYQANKNQIWLRRSDSNRRPSGYTNPTITNGRGLSLHHARNSSEDAGCIVSEPSS